MDSKLKALKVVDLKAILANANLPCPAKSTKPDIIARIIASSSAINSYYQLYDPQSLQSPIPPSPSPSPPSPVPPPQKSVSQPIPEPPPSDTPKDLEAEKRLQRAARFGIPLVDSSKLASNGVSANLKHSSSPKSLPDDLEKLNARATRFGIQQPSASQKPSAVLAHVDPEEVERRRKRAERFGLPTAA